MLQEFLKNLICPVILDFYNNVPWAFEATLFFSQIVDTAVLLVMIIHHFQSLGLFLSEQKVEQSPYSAWIPISCFSVIKRCFNLQIVMETSLFQRNEKKYKVYVCLLVCMRVHTHICHLRWTNTECTAANASCSNWNPITLHSLSPAVRYSC